MYITWFFQLICILPLSLSWKKSRNIHVLKYTSLIYTDYTWNVHNGIDKSLDQCNQVIYILPEIYFTNLYRFPETENLLYIDLKTCQYHSVHFRYNLYKLLKYISKHEYYAIFFSWVKQVIYILAENIR